MIKSHMLRSVAVCAFLDLRIPSGSGKITEKKLRTHQVGIEGILHFGRISMKSDALPKSVDFFRSLNIIIVRHFVSSIRY